MPKDEIPVDDNAEPEDAGNEPHPDNLAELIYLHELKEWDEAVKAREREK